MSCTAPLPGLVAPFLPGHTTLHKLGHPIKSQHPTQKALTDGKTQKKKSSRSPPIFPPTCRKGEREEPGDAKPFSLMYHEKRKLLSLLKKVFDRSSFVTHKQTQLFMLHGLRYCFTADPDPSCHWKAGGATVLKQLSSELLGAPGIFHFGGTT